MVWLFDQVTSLGTAIDNHVVCEHALNLDRFHVDTIHCVTGEFPIRSRWDRTLRKVGMRAGLGVKTEVIRNIGADVLHSHFGNYGWGDIEASARAGVRHIVTFYGVDVNKLPSSDPRWIERYRHMFRSANHFLCEGPHMAECLKKLGCPPDKIAVHHLGVRVSRIRFEPRQPCRGRPFRILMCASFVEKKGLPYALEALGALGRDIPFEATLIGGSNGTPEHEAERKRILAAIDRFDLAGRLKIAGFMPYDRVIAEVYKHDVFLSPSITGSDGDTEGGAPVTIALMAATGMPIVSTTHCDIPEIVKHGISALLAPERDSAALTEHLRWLHGNGEQWRSFGTAARERILAEFDCERQGMKLAQIYGRIADGRPCLDYSGIQR